MRLANFSKLSKKLNLNPDEAQIMKKKKKKKKKKNAKYDSTDAQTKKNMRL